MLGLGPSHFVEGVVELLYDVEPVHGDGGVLEALADGGQEGRRHVARHLDHVAGLAAVGFQELLEAGDGFLALAGGGEQHRLFPAVEVDEDGDIVVAPLRGGLVEAERLQFPEVEPFHGPGHVEIDDPPQPLVGDADELGGGLHRHFPGQRQGRLPEQPRDPAVFPGPRDHDPLDPVLGTPGPWNLGDDETVVLEEVQVLPHELLEIMCLAQPAAIRAGKFRTTIRFQPQVKFMRSLVRIQTLIDQSPRRRHPETKGENFMAVHPAASRPVPMPRKVADHAVKNRSDSTCRVQEPFVEVERPPNRPGTNSNGW